jgi:hypothetical protein
MRIDEFKKGIEELKQRTKKDLPFVSFGYTVLCRQKRPVRC